MITLERRKDKKWIFQKNISSKDIIKSYVEAIEELKDINDKEKIQRNLKLKNAYRGRSDSGSLNTMGVRFSQMCFYMFGYKDKQNVFMPTEMTRNILNDENNISENMLVSLFSIQYPHPYSDTPLEFEVYAGRLIVKLLSEDRIDRKLYIDEFIWFLPFIKTINKKTYEELVDSILEFRGLTYEQKNDLFHSVKNYNDVFANCMHECKYYFMRIFEGFGVFELIEDSKHNDGKLLSFKHGNTSTYRKDNISRVHSGYVKLKDGLLDSARKLISKYSAFDKPETLASEDIYSKEEWIINLYDVKPLSYLATILSESKAQDDVIQVINNMAYASKYGSVDGKDFENSLKPVFELFDKVINVEIISGSGDTDLLCAIEDRNKDIYKMNVDGKSRNSSNNMNVKRLLRHLLIHGSKYCVVVAPRFSKGTILDLEGEKVVGIRSDVLAKYCSKECLSSPTYTADYEAIENIIINNLGCDISENINDLINERYGISLTNSIKNVLKQKYKNIEYDFNLQPALSVAEDDIASKYGNNN